MNQQLDEIVKPIIGPVFSRHTTATKIVLTLSFDGPEWASQAMFLKKQLIATLNEHLPIPINDIEFQVRRTK